MCDKLDKLRLVAYQTHSLRVLGYQLFSEFSPLNGISHYFEVFELQN